MDGSLRPMSTSQVLDRTFFFIARTYASDFIGALIAGPIAAIAMALVYYDERVRKEAFDLQVMMDLMKRSDSAQVASV